jgi:hypothetical protein
MKKCKEAFDIAKQMTMGTINEEMVAKYVKLFAGFFAPVIEFAVNPNADGPKATGSFEQVIQTSASVWMGFKVTRIENMSFRFKADNVIVVSQACDNHLIDASGVEIPGTANKGLEVTQTVTYDAYGKISVWTQEYDAKKAQASRNMAACREAFTIQRGMALGEMNDAFMSEASAKFADLYAPKFDLHVNPKASGPKLLGGTLVDAMDVVGPLWLGFRNTEIENKSFVAIRDDAVAVTQVYHSHLTDASGAEVAGTAVKNEVVQTMTYNAEGKICSWVHEYDSAKVRAAREAHILHLCRETCEAQTQLAMGEVTEAMLAEFGQKFASSFTPTFEMTVNPEIHGPCITGTFSEVMEAVGRVWIGFKNTKLENVSFSAKGDSVVVVTQRWHQQLLDASGDEVPGACHILDVQTTNTYAANGKIEKVVQEFDAAKVEASRRVARKVAELMDHAHKGEILVEPESEAPKPTGCGLFGMCL